MKHKIEVGQTLYERGRNGIKEVVVSKVGRDNFYLSSWGGKPDMSEPFKLDTLKFVNKNYCQFSRQLYISREDIEKDVKREQLEYNVAHMMRHITLSKLSDDDLNSLHDLLNRHFN